MDSPSILAVNQTKPIRYEVIDLRDGRTKASYYSRTYANSYADRKNDAYGAHRFAVKAIWSIGENHG